MASKTDMKKEAQDEEEEGGLWPEQQMKQLEEENRRIWLLYKDTQLHQKQQEQQQQQWNEEGVREEQECRMEDVAEGRSLLANPLMLTPGVRYGERSMMEEEEEEDSDDEEDEEMEGLLPGRQMEEAEEQNRIIYSLYENSLQRDTVVPSCPTGTPVASETSGTHTSSHLRQHSSTHPTSSTPSLAADCSGPVRIKDMEPLVKGLVAQKPSAQKALQLNLALQNAFRSTITKVEEALKKNQKAQAQIMADLEALGCTMKDSVPSNTYYSTENEEERQRPFLKHSHFCVPYFKDASGMSAPMNEDAKQKINMGYLDLYTTRSRSWTWRETKRLTEVLEEEWKEEQIRRSQRRVQALHREVNALRELEEADETNVIVANTRNKVTKAEAELETLKGTEAKNLRPPPRSETLDWEKIAAHAFDGSRSSLECELIWKNLLHPNINREAWTEEDDLTIQSLVKMPVATKSNNWDAIARCLGTNRTGYLVMQRWVHFLQPTLYPVRWTAQDTKRLLDAVNLLRTGDHIPWSQVHQHLPGYTRAQVHSRWQVVNPGSRFGQFSLEEDTVMIKGMYAFGFNFSSIAHFLPGRTAARVREKFRRTFLPGMTTIPWTRHEDNLLRIHGREDMEGSRKLLQYLPRRVPTQNRCRYLTLKVWDSLKKEKDKSSPPPIFPLTLTTDQEEVKNIRSLMIQESPRLKEELERTRKGLTSQKEFIQELENQRVALQQKAAGSTSQRMQQLVFMRGRPQGTTEKSLAPSTLPVHSFLFDRFFQPARECQVEFPVTDEVVLSLKLLSDVLLLRPTHIRQNQQELGKEEGIGMTYMTQRDLELLERLVATKRQEEQQQGVERQDDCSSGGSRSRGGGVDAMSVAAMPLIPPNLATLGALQSIFIHIPVLREMASGNFIFQNFSPTTLACMTETQLMKVLMIQHDPPRLKANSERQQQQREGSTKAADTSANTCPSSPCPPATSISVRTGRREVPWDSNSEQRSDSTDDDENSADVNSELRGADPGSEWCSDTELNGAGESHATQHSPFKIHITSEKSVQKYGRKRVLMQDVMTPNFNTYLKGSRKSAPGEASRSTCRAQETQTLPHTSNSHSLPQQNTTESTVAARPPSMALESGRGQQNTNGEREEGEEGEARQKADELLFQRMLSLFFWPTIMTTESPTGWQMEEAEYRMTRFKAEEEEGKHQHWKSKQQRTEKPMKVARRMKKGRWSATIDNKNAKNVDVEKITEHLEEVNKCLKESLAKKQGEGQEASTETKASSPGMKRRRKRKRSLEPDGDSQQNASPKMQRESASPPPPPLPPQNTELAVVEKSQASSPPALHDVKTRRAITLSITRNEQRLKRLRRSLAMKKVWEARQQGNVAERKNKEKFVGYKPRASRSRSGVQHDSNSQQFITPHPPPSSS